MSRLPMRSVVPPVGLGTPRELGPQPDPGTIGRLVALRRKIDENRASEDGKVGELHRGAAPLFAAVLDAYGKDDAAREVIGETKGHLSDMRSGVRGVSFWQLLALLLDSREAFEAFAAPLCEHHGLEPPQAKPRLTRAQIAEEWLDATISNPLLLDALAKRMAERHGAEPEETVRALREVAK